MRKQITSWKDDFLEFAYQYKNNLPSERTLKAEMDIWAKEACWCNSRPSFDHVKDDEGHLLLFSINCYLFKTDWDDTGNHMLMRRICVVIKKTKNLLEKHNESGKVEWSCSHACSW